MTKHNEISLMLPWPPSMNSYWRRHGHIIHVSAKGKQFAAGVHVAVRKQWQYSPLSQNVSVLVEAWAPTRRSWDVDNRLKPLLDALTKAEFWEDDKQVRDLRIVDRGIKRNGQIALTVWPLEHPLF